MLGKPQATSTPTQKNILVNEVEDEGESDLSSAGSVLTPRDIGDEAN